MSYADEIMKSLEKTAESLIVSTEQMLREARVTSLYGERIRDVKELTEKEVRC